jgi:hypothetical protein
MVVISTSPPSPSNQGREVKREKKWKEKERSS